MIGLITDRNQVHVDRLNDFVARGWAGLTDAERAEWVGDIRAPEAAGYEGAVNLLPNNNYYSGGVAIEFGNKAIKATALYDGGYNYAVVIIGNAADYENKTLTLSIESILTSGTAAPNIALYWHDGNGYEHTGAAMSEAGSLTFHMGANVGGRASLAMYIYVASDVPASTGDYVQYAGVMLEAGDTAHEYVPYTAALPTPVRKGAYNYTDLNRVELCIAELARELSLDLVTKTDWAEWDVPTKDDMDRFLSNVVAVRAAGSPLATTPDAPRSMAKLDHVGANNIEKIIADIDIMVNHLFRCGELYCGEV